MSRSVFYGAKSGVAIEMTQPLYRTPCLNGILPDRIFLQTLPSMLASHVLQVSPGMRVLDMCSAPGGKTTHLAILMKDQGELVAIDKNEKKIEQVKKLCELMGITCVTCYKGDSTKLLSNSNEISPKFPPESFDRVLLDPPCSGLGQRPKIKEGMGLKQLKSHADHQKKLADCATQLVKPGGILVYSTCTIHPLENEMMVRYILDSHPTLKLEEQHPILSESKFTGMHGALTSEEAQLCQYFDPRVNKDSIGFFIAKFRKLDS
eukprot:TRINITY_DN9414_c0_g1_i3.p1 TRINITY_DN9414_c0_g1~~TRINITY_DN9414_c0_g1_i3.p1  ORF type:complete len:263 (-),score=63.73 TRINITY_DN9414_c0_g1_i3:58-846(-)